MPDILKGQTASQNPSSTQAIKAAFKKTMHDFIGKPMMTATPEDLYKALAYTVRSLLLERYIRSVETYLRKDVRTVAYFSAEFLIGPQLAGNMLNLGIMPQVEQAMEELGLDLSTLIDIEVEPGLGNGGLGRLAACYLDSLATLRIPAIGYGLRYEHGMFEQRIENGWQVEYSDNWLHFGNPWELYRPEVTYSVKFGGFTEGYRDSRGSYRVRWKPGMKVKGIAYDIPVIGYQVSNCVLLRLWQAEATEGFDFQDFNRGDFYGAVEQKVMAENITKVLYPNDNTMAGKRLRLQQQYFMVSCSIQDLLHNHLVKMKVKLTELHNHMAAQLNDTHPSLAIPEMMRLLVDHHHIPWEPAWDVTRQTFAYTNHTILPEALEKWPLPMFSELLPRHIEIIYEINRRFLDEVRIHYPMDTERVAALSLIDESDQKYVRMANLACVGSHKINGVSRLHTRLLENIVLRKCHEYWPDKIINITNGVTPRRWIAVSNPRLTELVTEAIGDGWLKDMERLHELESFADDAAFREKWHRAKKEHKNKIANLARKNFNWIVDPDSMFDVQVKRIHEYKRQHLNCLHIITLYWRLKNGIDTDMAPRTFIFGGKAAPGYFMAKLIIKFITSIAKVINSDPEIKNKIKVIFRPNYNVKIGQLVYPLADLSEQISLAGMEASGTGNMKFAMNGALTIGTLDGANVEIREKVGEDNFFNFGMTAQQVLDLKNRGYNPYDFYNRNDELKNVIALIESGHFSHGDTSLFKPLTDELKFNDQYMLLADYESYVKCQEQVGQAYGNRDEWTKKSIITAARMGHFSSDRSISEYAKDIWQVEPVDIKIGG